MDRDYIESGDDWIEYSERQWDRVQKHPESRQIMQVLWLILKHVWYINRKLDKKVENEQSV